jgi:hypothetical protein
VELSAENIQLPVQPSAFTSRIASGNHGAASGSEVFFLFPHPFPHMLMRFLISGNPYFSLFLSGPDVSSIGNFMCILSE